VQGHIVSNPMLEGPAVFNSRTVSERTYSNETFGSKHIGHLRMRRFISLAGNPLNLFLVTSLLPASNWFAVGSQGGSS
jgi:hypothetical protein